MKQTSLLGRIHYDICSSQNRVHKRGSEVLKHFVCCSMSVQNVSQCTKPHFTAGTATSQRVFGEIRHARNNFLQFLTVLFYVSKYTLTSVRSMYSGQSYRKPPNGTEMRHLGRNWNRGSLLRQYDPCIAVNLIGNPQTGQKCAIWVETGIADHLPYWSSKTCKVANKTGVVCSLGHETVGPQNGK